MVKEAAETTALATTERPGQPAPFPKWTNRQWELVRNLICPGASPDEMQLFGYVCKRTGLDPFAKQIYGIMRYDGRLGRKKMSIQTSIDGLRLTAQRSNAYAGSDDPEYGPMVESDKVQHPEWAKVAVYKMIGGIRVKFVGICWWDEYRQVYYKKEQRKDEKTGKMVEKKIRYLGEKWQSMPRHMLAKCAEALGLRKGFPAECYGLVTDDEMGSAAATTPARQVQQPQRKSTTTGQITPPPVRTYNLTDDHNKLRNRLLEITGKDEKAAANELERITTWVDKKKNTHQGVRAINRCSPKMAEIALKQLEREVGSSEALQEEGQGEFPLED